jgi:hypothetical protein
MKESEGFFQANDATDGVGIKIAPDGRTIRLRVLPIGADRGLGARFLSWVRRRPQYSAVWFLRRLESGRTRDLVEALESFWVAVDEPQLRYLTPEETLDAISQFFRGGSLDERASRKSSHAVQADDDGEVNWTALYAQFSATYGVPDPGMSWIRFLVLVNEIEGEEARARLRLMDSSFWGTARAFPGEGAGLLDSERKALARRGEVVRRPETSGLVINQSGRANG